MKNQLLCSLVLYLVSSFSFGLNSELVVALILNDEDREVVTTIKPLIDAGIQSLVIVAVGERDNPLKEVRSVLDKAHNINSHIVSKQSEDDSFAYNYALDFAKETFPDASFMLSLEAGWHVHGIEQLVQFCTDAKNNSCCTYRICLKRDGATEEYVTSLIRLASGVRFEPAAYEYRAENKEVKNINADSIFLEWNPARGCVGNFIEKQKRLQKSLLNRLNKNSTEARALFLLAQSYELMGDYIKAFEFYERRSQVEDDAEERFLAFYRMGKLIEQTTKNRESALYYYQKAHEIEPERAEPLIKCAQYYFDTNNKELGFLLLSQTLQLPYPRDCRLTVEKDLYDYTRYDLMGIHAWYMKEYERGESALRRALEINPHNEHLKQNLDFYLGRKKSKQPKSISIPEAFGVNFDDSMICRLKDQYPTILENCSLLKKARAIYEQYICHDLEYNFNPRIPKIIHQIWLGKPMPENYKILQKSWSHYHPDWEYRLWTEQEIDEFGLQNRALFDQALNYGEKADIARLEILYRMGGLYVDMDFECIKPFDVFHHCCDFYAGFETEDMICNALIGAAPGHPILKRCVEQLCNQTSQYERTDWRSTLDRTGPNFFGKCIAEVLPECQNRSVVFPVTYFYFWRPAYGTKRKIEDILQTVLPETFAIHHWHSSWAG